MPKLGRRRGAHLPLAAVEPVGGWTTWVRDAWPVRRQTYGYLSSIGASPLFDQIILLGDRGTCVWTTCLKSLPGSVPVRSRTCAPEWPQDYKSGTLPLDYRATLGARVASRFNTVGSSQTLLYTSVIVFNISFIEIYDTCDYYRKNVCATFTKNCAS